MSFEPSTRALAGGATLLVVAALAWFSARRAAPEPHVDQAAGAGAAPVETAALAPKPIPTRTRPAPAPAGADAEAPLRGADDANDTELREPHPPTPERLAMIPPWGTVDDVRAAHDARDFERARDILRQRKLHDARWQEWRDFYTGLELIGDCLEAPSAATRGRADAFIKEFRASPMRRHVRRACGVASPSPAH